MISISAYRRYPQPQWYYRQTQSRPAPPPRPQPRAEEQKAAPPPAPPPEPPKTGPSRPNGLAGALGAFLPEGIDSGDLFLAAMLLFLYSESHDEEFLIILIVVGLSIFRKDKDKK